MRDSQDEDEQSVVLDRVDDAVVADPDPPSSLRAAADNLRSRGSRVDAGKFDRARDV